MGATETKSDLLQVDQLLNEFGLRTEIEAASAQMLAWYEMPGSLWEVAGPLGHATYCGLVVNEEGQRGLVYLSIETQMRPGWHAFLAAYGGPRGDIRVKDGCSKYHRSLGEWHVLYAEHLRAIGGRRLAWWDMAEVRIEPDTREEWERA